MEVPRQLADTGETRPRPGNGPLLACYCQAAEKWVVSVTAGLVMGKSCSSVSRIIFFFLNNGIIIQYVI